MRQELGICKGLLMETKMHDPRMNRLAEILTCHSTKIEVGEFVLIEGFDIPTDPCYGYIEIHLIELAQPTKDI